MAVLPDTFVLSVTYGFRLLVQAAPPLKTEGKRNGRRMRSKHLVRTGVGEGGEMIFKQL